MHGTSPAMILDMSYVIELKDCASLIAEDFFYVVKY